MQRSQFVNFIYAKKFDKYTPATQKQIHRAILKIPMGDIKALIGKSSPQMYRLRVSKYCIIFYYPNKENTCILKIDSRGDVYK